MATNALAPQNENALASFGLFPHINKYRKFNDPISSANMPVQAALGSAAATGGFLSDLLSNFQSPTGNEITGDVNYEQNIKLPYGTQELSKMLPLQPTTPNERFARGLGEMVPVNPAPALRAVGKVGEMTLRGAGEMANARMLSGESMVPGLSSVLAPSMMKFAKEPGVKKLSIDEITAFQEQKRQRERAQAVQWEEDRVKDKVLANEFIKNIPNMGTGANFNKDQLDSIAQYRLSGDRLGALAEGANQTVNLLKQKLQGMGAKIVGESQKGGGNSVYVDFNGKTIRISDHELPDTPERLHNKEMGLTGKWNSEIITRDWTTKKLDDYLKDAEFKN